MRIHIGLFGRRNVGKSSLLNALTGQPISIVSDHPGTTTDPVEKAMELQPLGPVLFIDTAGVDDEGELGTLRVARTRSTIDRCDLALVITDNEWGPDETELLHALHKQQTPVIAVRNKCDQPDTPSLSYSDTESPPSLISVSAKTGSGLSQLRHAILEAVPAELLDPPDIAADLLPPGGLAMLVVPIDKEAPKGRLILPQVQVIRDLLDHDAYCMVVKERELAPALERLQQPPDLVITDSQAFLRVAADTPDSVPLTSFSILFARFKGDLTTLVKGAAAVESLRSGDRVLIAEACTHHPIGEDIGRVKIPRWLTRYTGCKLEFDVVAGKTLPDNLASYKLVIHCGACTFNRKLMLSRILACQEAGVPITNYGVAIAYSLGIIERALGPFPQALSALHASDPAPPFPEPEKGN
jgi:[FeFe] hydrogenase H-cluster maturation GTPase HydF